jgi:iron(III) transport system ATP-binding protein
VSTISCRGISKSFGPLRVLRGLHLEVPDGAIVTLLGASGSGKTTLLRLIAGFERPDAGTVTLDGEVVDSRRRFVPPDKRRIGFVAQEGNLFPHLTVAKNIAFGLSRAEQASGRVEEMLDLVGLADLAKRYPHQLSGGQQQRVALARALAPRPRLMLLDEPFSSLDAGLRSSLRFDVMRILRAQHATTVFVTHDQSEALSIADLVGIMSGGRIAQFARPETLYDHPVDAAVARFLGEANIIDGTASDGLVHTAFGDLILANGTDSLTGPAVVLVRPEQITLRHLTGSQSGPRRASGLVVHREYYGHDCVVLVALDEGEQLVRVRCAGRAPVEVGETVAVSADGEVVAWSAEAQHLDVGSAS